MTLEAKLTVNNKTKPRVDSFLFLLCQKVELRTYFTYFHTFSEIN